MGLGLLLVASLGTGCDLIRCQWGRSEDANRSCSAQEEKDFVYDNLTDRYLFADQVPYLDLNAFETSEELLNEVKRTVQPRDRFSYIQTRVASEQAEAGVFGGLGARLSFWSGQGLLITRVFGTFPKEPATAASDAGLKRGEIIVSVEGEPVADLEGWEAFKALGPNEKGVTRTLEVLRPDGETYTVTVEKRPFAQYTTPVVRTYGDGIGYVLFESFLDRAKDELYEAFGVLRDAGVNRLILDLRWNGGGRGSTSRYLLGLIVGRDHEGEPAYVHRFNDEYDSCSNEYNLERKSHSLTNVIDVVIITGPGTASASELVWNSLRPYVHVQTVGSRTVGKPYGFYPYDFCGKVLRATNYRRENALGQSVPEEGIVPDCEAADTVTGPLGEPSDNLLGHALDLLRGRGCLQASWRGATIDPALDENGEPRVF